jgi:glycosyltransferase involved in cell wall biosynthesis
VTAPREDAARTRPLRILVLNWLDRENPQAGGAETHLHEVFGRLAARGHEVTALVSGWRGCERRASLDGIDVHRSGRRYTYSLTSPVYFRRRLAARGFDVVVEDLNKVPVFSPLWAGVPVVLLAHHLFGATAFQAGPVPVAVATWVLERPVPRVFARARAIAVSESTRDDLVARGLARDLIDVVPNGIDLEHYTPASELRASRATILVLGRLKEYKRVDLVIDAVAVLAGEGLDVQLEIVGDGERLEALRAQARSLGIEDRVHFLGFVAEERKLEALRRAWVHVLTSPKEGWGISNLEAAACATPSVASDSPGLRESVVDGETGILVPHGEVGPLAEALGRLLRDRELHARLARGARSFAEKFSWEASADGVEAVLRRVVDETDRY